VVAENGPAPMLGATQMEGLASYDCIKYLAIRYRELAYATRCVFKCWEAGWHDASAPSRRAGVLIDRSADVNARLTQKNAGRHCKKAGCHTNWEVGLR